MKIGEEASKDDFGIHAESQDIVVSERALDLLEDLGIPGATVQQVDD